jgi:hypothetical protein
VALPACVLSTKRQFLAQITNSQRLNIEMRHIELIRSEKVMMANDIYFVRKVADPEIVNQLEQFLQAQREIQRLTIER